MEGEELERERDRNSNFDKKIEAYARLESYAMCVVFVLTHPDDPTESLSSIS